MRIIKLKVFPEYFSAIKDGSKPFEVRRDKHDYEVGDVLLLQEWQPNTLEVEPGVPKSAGDYTGLETLQQVTYVFRNPEFLEGFPSYLNADTVVLGLKPAEVIG